MRAFRVSLLVSASSSNGDAGCSNKGCSDDGNVHQEEHEDACHGRGSSCWPKIFRSDGAPQLPNCSISLGFVFIGGLHYTWDSYLGRGISHRVTLSFFPKKDITCTPVVACMQMVGNGNRDVRTSSGINNNMGKNIS